MAEKNTPKKRMMTGHTTNYYAMIWGSKAKGFVKTTTFHQPVNCFYYTVCLSVSMPHRLHPQCEYDTWANKCSDVHLCNKYLKKKPNHSTEQNVGHIFAVD